MKNSKMLARTVIVSAVFFNLYTVGIAQKTTFKSIFNGKNLRGWIAPENNIWWSADNGILVAKSGPNKKGSILWTKKKYKDFVIKTDFLFGEGIIDSGIFIRTDKQQIQIGVSGSLKRDMTASPYIPGKGYPVEAEGVSKLLKLQDWNTIKIQARGKVYQVWLNGKEVLEYESEDAIAEGPIGLQMHAKRDMKISYRNIEVAKLH